MTALELLEKAREACEPPTWYRLAKECHTSEGVVHTWRKRNGAFSDDAAYELARLLAMSPIEVIATREASIEKDEVRRARWLERLGKRAAMASGIFLLPLTFLCPAGDASATGLALNWKSSNDMLQIMRRWWDRQRRAFAGFPGLRPPSRPGCPALA